MEQERLMIAEVATVISVIKGLNDAISTIKETGGHASDLGDVMGRYATANEAVQDVESKYVGRLSVRTLCKYNSPRGSLRCLISSSRTL